MTCDPNLLRIMWIRAFRDGTCSVTLPSHAEAVRTRFALYGVAKRGRKGLVSDVELQEARDHCSIRIAGAVLTILRNDQTATSQAIAAQLGLDAGNGGGAPLPSIPGTDAEESLRRLLESSAEKGNPFYTRGE